MAKVLNAHARCSLQVAGGEGRVCAGTLRTPPGPQPMRSNRARTRTVSKAEQDLSVARI
jgi:hypothetical protein